MSAQPTIRRLAIELASDPDIAERPVPTFDDPGIAKLHADAYLAICINQIAHRVTTAAGRPERFQADFLARMQGRAPLTASDDLRTIIERFGASFKAVYQDRAVTYDVMHNTAIGQRAVEACHAYATAADRYHHPAEGRGRAGNGRQIPVNPYRHPEGIMSNGYDLLAQHAGRFLLGLNYLQLDPEATVALIDGTDVDLVQLCNLSLAQSQAYTPGLPVLDGGRLNTVPDIEAARRLPKYNGASDAVIRPHRGCPAMPSFPAVGLLPGGSAIRELWLPITRHTLENDMHALHTRAMPQGAEPALATG